MNIKINDNFEIDCDGTEFVLKEKYMGKDKETKEPKEQFYPDRYYPSLESCCKMLIDRMVVSANKDNQMTAPGILNAIAKAQFEIANAIKDAGLTIKEIYGRKI